jgi:hypothetical protein
MERYKANFDLIFHIPVTWFGYASQANPGFALPAGMTA